MIENFDKFWLSFFNSLLDSSVKDFVFFMADAPIFFLPVFLVSMWLYYTFKSNNPTEKKEELLAVFYGVVSSVLCNKVVQHIVERNRPETFLENKANFTLSHIPDASFPSDHAAVATSFLIWIYLFGYKKTFMVMAPLFLIMLLSRIAWGVHWPTDILAGMTVWAIFAVTITKCYKKGYLTKLNQLILKLDFTSYFRK